LHAMKHIMLSKHSSKSLLTRHLRRNTNDADETAMTVQSAVMPANDGIPTAFEAHVRAIQIQLIDSVRQAGIGSDPYSRIVEAQAAAIGVLPEFVRTVKDHRSPFSEQQRQEFEHALTTGTAVALNRLTWWLIARNLVLAVGALTAALAMGGGVGYWLGYGVGVDQTVQVQSGLERALKGRDAKQWLSLIRLNNGEEALRHCTPVAQSGDGLACSVTLWTKLPSPKGGNR
jgi:hypothetical protein